MLSHITLHLFPLVNQMLQSMFSKLANVVCCQKWQILPVTKTGKYHQLPKLENIFICQNWHMLQVAKLENIARCQIWHQLPKYCQLLNLANFLDT